MAKMKKDESLFRAVLGEEWKNAIPKPVCEDMPEYYELYEKAWEIAHQHIRRIKGMPQSPYMDEAFCDTQIWIWDTCFMSLFCKYAQGEFPGVESLRNFYDVLYGDKCLPTVIPSEKEPKWTGATPGVPSQIKIHIADNPPLFAFAEYENALFSGDKDYIRDLLYRRGVLQKHYRWLEELKASVALPGVLVPTCLVAEEKGYKWEGGRSGMDNTPRGKTEPRATADRPNNPHMLWVDAICQQALSAKNIAKLFSIVGDEENAQIWEKLYQEKKELVNRYYWDEQDKFYYDIDCRDLHFYRVMTPASFWALVAEIAPGDRAEFMVARLFEAQTLGGEVPLVSLSKSDGDYDSSGKYWRGGLWLPTAYAALKGIEAYGYLEQAHSLAEKILRHMLRTYKEYQPHTIWECYAPASPAPATKTSGSGVVRSDFCGWSALGPISLLIENVIGFYSVNAFEKVVKWHKPKSLQKALGIRNLHFGEITTDIVAEGNICRVKSNRPYTLVIDGKAYAVKEGEQVLFL